MIALDSFNARLRHYSILYNMLRDYHLIASNPIRHLKRLQVGKSFCNPDLQIDSKSGYLITSASKLEGLTELISRLQIFATPRAEQLSGDHKVSQKPYYFNILNRIDAEKIPELIGFSLSPAMLRILAPYYGFIPNLSHIGVFLSAHASTTTTKGTQNAHWDNHDLRHVKMFSYLSDVGPDDGPLTFLPADKSAWLRRKTGRIFRTPPIRDDSEWRRFFTDKDLVQVTGPAGTTAFLNTSDCMHFGSRCKPEGRRLALVLHYAKFAEYSFTWTKNFEDLNVATSPELRPQNLDEAAALMFHLLQPELNNI